MTDDEVTGWSDEGCCDYEGETIYEARVEVEHVVHSIYFMFSHRQNVARVSIMRADVSDSEWVNYTVASSVEIHYQVPKGTWIMRMSMGSNLVWLFKQRGTWYKPILSKANDERETDAQKEARKTWGTQYTLKPEYTTAEEVKKTIEWHKQQKAKERRDDMIDAAVYGISMETARRHRQGIITSIKEEEVKKKMYLQAIDVIFFDRKTKKVVYREIVVASETQGAFMLAAQDFGKYDPKVHVKYAHCMFGFNEQNAEDDSEEEK